MYQAPLFIDGNSTGNTLTIYKIDSSGFRVRVQLGDTLASYRYNFDRDNVVVNATALESRAPLNLTQGNTTDILTTPWHSVHIQVDGPLSLEFFAGNISLLKVNDRQLLFIEDGSSTPPVPFGGINETFPHGKTALGIDATFPNGSYISGLAEGTVPSNLNNGIYRRYALDGYSEYGVLPLAISHSSQHYFTPSIFFLNPSDSFYTLSTLEDGRRSISTIHEGGFIDLIVFLGPLHEVIHEYTRLTGVAPLPPAWALGYQQSKWGYQNQTEVEGVIANFTQYGIPFDAIWLDIDHLANRAPFMVNRTNFPNLTELARSLSLNHRTLIRITDPHLPVANDPPSPQYLEANASHYFVADANGDPVTGDCWPGLSSWPDYYREDIRQWWANQFNLSDDNSWASNIHVWNDMNEVADWSGIEGTFNKDSLILNKTMEVREAHSLYALYETAGTYLGLKQRADVRPFVLTRSFFSGSQKYAWFWSGDNDSNEEHLKLSVQMSVAAGLAGFPLTGSDVGGYSGNPTARMLARWINAAALTQPLFRVHSAINTVRREPFLWNETNPAEYAAMVQGINLRYRLINLWYSAAHAHTLTSRPIVEPMWGQFNDEKFHTLPFQVLVGDRLLACPVVTIDDDPITIVKPPGRWFCLHTHKELTEDVTANTTIDSAPAFIRGGTMVPLHEPQSSATSTMLSNITLRVALNEENHSFGELYLDDLNTFAYTTGAFNHIHISFTNTSFNSTVYGDPLPLYNNTFITTIFLDGTTVVPPYFQNYTVEVLDNYVKITNISLQINIPFRLPEPTPPTPPTSPTPSPSDDTKKRNLIIGCSVGGGALVIIVIIVIVCCCRKTQIDSSKALLEEPLPAH